MANGSTFLGEISAMIAQMKKHLDETRVQAEALVTQANDIQANIDALERTAKLFRRTHSLAEPIDSRGLKGKTQIEALEIIAKKDDGLLRANEAKRLLLEAGLIRTPKNAASIVYTLIKRSDKFDWVSKGVYRLRNYHPNVTRIRLASA